jgi:hypothetical protein
MRDRLQKLEVFQGDMLQDAGILVIPVNCVPGVMGKGLAKQFADVCPEAEGKHRWILWRGNLSPGRPCIFTDIYHSPVVYFATKRDWRNKSKLVWISDGLNYLSWMLSKGLSIDAIHHPAIIMPALGCGEGGLKYADVYPLIADFANSLPKPYHVRLYRPHNSNE